MSNDIKVGAELHATMRRLELTAPGAISRALDSKLIPIVKQAKRDWPKKTGFSASILRLRVEVENGRIVKYVENNAPYAGAVFPEGKPGELSKDTLVFDPIAAALNPILEAFAQELAKT